jgi:phosphoglycolate phosphatase-like HAD superfamily hydrolase
MRLSTFGSTIIFDLDGTLIDSAAVVSIVLNSMRKNAGKEALGIDFYKKWISRGALQLISNSLEVDIKSSNSHLEEFRRRYFDLPTPTDCLYLGVKETISELICNNKVGICSNKPEKLCRKIINETGLGEMVSVIVGGDTLSFSKPFRQPIDYAIKLLDGKHETAVLVGDSTIDQLAALAANIDFIFFSKGYDDGVDTSKALKVIDEIPQLIRI